MYWHERGQQRAAARDPNPVTDQAMPPVNPNLWPGFTRYLTDRGLDAELARANGWYPSDRAGDTDARIVIPATASAGHIYWQARSMTTDEPRRKMLSPTYARRDSIVWVWPKRFPELAVIVCEGPMDALAAAEIGGYSAAMMGADPPWESITYLALMVWQQRTSSMPTRRVLVVPDNDSSGMTLTKIQFVLGTLGLDGEVRIPPAKDLASMALADRQAFLRS